MSDDNRHCYRVRLPSEAEARRILGMEPLPARTINGHHYEAASEEPGPMAFLCGDLGPPCVHCGGVSDALCDFPLGDEGRTCDRALCLACAPNVGRDGRRVPEAEAVPEADYRNYCHEHDEHGRGMLLFPARAPAKVAEPGPPKRQRARPLPKTPPEHQRWRVRQGRNHASPGAVLTGWKSELDARRFAVRVGGYVETWDEFVALWRELYPLAPRSRRHKDRGDITP